MTTSINHGGWDSIDFGLSEPTPVVRPTPSVPYSVASRSNDALFDDLLPGTTVTLPTSQRSTYDPDPEEPEERSAYLINPTGAPGEWPAQMPMAIAMDVEDLHSILERFDISPERFSLIQPLPAFRKALAEAQKSLRETGHTFGLKCKGIAEEFLDQIYLELYNPLVGLSTKIDIFKYLTKMASLEPVPQKDVFAPLQNQVQIVINLDAPAPQVRQINI